MKQTELKKELKLLFIKARNGSFITPLIEQAIKLFVESLPEKNKDVPSNEPECDSPEYNRAIGWNTCLDQITKEWE